MKNTLDADGSLAQVQSKKNSGDFYRPYASNFAYNAAGAVTSMRLGNGKFENTAFNSRLQPIQIGLGSSVSDHGLLKLDYTYGTTNNNGNVLSQTITVPTIGANTGFVATQTYNYDSLNRIKDATENITPNGGSSSQSWKQAFTYDRYGNRNFDEADTTTLPKNCGTSPNFTVCAADRKVLNPETLASNNRIRGNQDGDGINDYTFDAAGNTTHDAQGRMFTYDAENKQVEVKDANGTIGEYFYDGDGKRVKKVVPATGELTIFVYDAAGKLVAEYSTVIAPPSEAKVSCLTNDHLGSPRINTNETGTVISRRDFMPFGEEIYTAQRTTQQGYTQDNTRQKFTSYERDKETDLDFAQARYYSSQLGRFTSVDPIFLKLTRVIDPQQFNRYSYVRNNPLKYVDVSGLDLKLKAGMKKADVDRIIKIYAKQYQKASGRSAIDKFEKSSIPITVGSGELPTTVRKDGTKTVINERYGETARTGTGQNDENGKLKSVTLSTITVTYDFDKRDNAQSRSLIDPKFPPPDSEQRVGNHETGHTEALITDAVKEISRTEEDSEKYANDFADKMEKEKETLKYNEAEEKAREFFDYDNYEFADKKKDKKPK